MRRIFSARVPGSYTVEAAGVFCLVFLTVMVLLNQAFLICAETTQKFAVHEEVEYERHRVANIDEKEIFRRRSQDHWSIEVRVPVFRPENSLRAWSLIGEG